MNTSVYDYIENIINLYDEALNELNEEDFDKLLRYSEDIIKDYY